MSNDQNGNNDPKEKLTDHEYDGIRELDNDLPRWWLATFYLTMAFAAGYYAYYELGNGSSIQQEYEHEVAAMEASRKAAAPALTFPDMTHLNVALKSGERIGAGKIVFQGKCISCHGDHGQGIIGPNLTDDYWIHGDGKPESIANTIHDGVSAKGMPPWNTLLSDEEIYSVTAYVKSLRGTNPPGAKAAQGELVKE